MIDEETEPLRGQVTCKLDGIDGRGGIWNSNLLAPFLLCLGEHVLQSSLRLKQRAVGNRKSREGGLGGRGGGKAGCSTDQRGQRGPLQKVRDEQSLEGEERVSHAEEWGVPGRGQQQPGPPGGSRKKELVWLQSGEPAGWRRVTGGEARGVKGGCRKITFSVIARTRAFAQSEAGTRRMFGAGQRHSLTPFFHRPLAVLKMKRGKG